MENSELKGIIEALLFVAGEPLSIDRIKAILEDADKRAIQAMLWELQHEYDMRLSGLRILEVAGGFQIASRPELAQWIKRLRKVKQSSRLSKPSLETLAIIAYKQPLVKAEIEDIRGVDSSGVLKGLLDKHMIKIVGRKDVAGRPILYATTREFLQYFGLRDISDLPTLKEFTELVPEEGTQISEDVIPESEVSSGSSSEVSSEASFHETDIIVSMETPGELKIKWIAFAIVTLLTIATIFLIPRIHRKIPEVPGNSTHVSVINVSECISCHIIADTSPLQSDHAARDKCLYCHKMQENSHYSY